MGRIVYCPYCKDKCGHCRGVMQSSLWTEREASNLSAPVLCWRSLVAIVKYIYVLRFKMFALVLGSFALVILIILLDKLTRSNLDLVPRTQASVIVDHGEIPFGEVGTRAAEDSKALGADNLERGDVARALQRVEEDTDKTSYQNAGTLWNPSHMNINKSDIIVVLHIQKTGGTTFETNLVVHTVVNPGCKCLTVISGPHKLQRPKCDCLNAKGQVWLFNRWTVGWPCGLHADFTEMSTCVDPWFRDREGELTRVRRYHYVTMLREPVERFVSEWRHVRSGATWESTRLFCDGRSATAKEVPPCYKGDTWRGVAFKEFVNCRSNLAFNRQTRMLANLSLSDCYRLSSNLTLEQRDAIMLASAKRNLANSFTFFGLLEYQAESSLLFQETFPGIRFKENVIENHNTKGERHAHLLPVIDLQRVIQSNQLDADLYQFAKSLFFHRLDQANIRYDKMPSTKK
ncbi:heparan-sulfate 6-O-sulfotransferase 2 [Aplysia californica]|uniref:Heparan-sulfate 6-O-sulfotransferase n=1 Tax=Aplysia californica TaxID=6500 RepID=A0ABM0JY28_APLCA|nr:heparan-sulfate 6-O-sulfotransferase 2 [Aplysia californica]